MVIFIAPIAAAGYMYWKKKQEARLEQEKAAEDEEPSDLNSSGESSQEEKTWDFVDDADQPKKSPSVATEETTSVATSEDLSDSMEESSRQAVLSQDTMEDEQLETPTVSPRESTVPAGPMAKFRKFYVNLEKEYAKAQERRDQKGPCDKKMQWFSMSDLDDPKIARANAPVPRITSK